MFLPVLTFFLFLLPGSHLLPSCYSRSNYYPSVLFCLSTPWTHKPVCHAFGISAIAFSFPALNPLLPAFPNPSFRCNILEDVMFTERWKNEKELKLKRRKSGVIVKPNRDCKAEEEAGWEEGKGEKSFVTFSVKCDTRAMKRRSGSLTLLSIGGSPLPKGSHPNSLGLLSAYLWQMTERTKDAQHEEETAT